MKKLMIIFLLLYTSCILYAIEIKLTDEEKSYIQEHKKIIFVGQKEYPPFEFLENDQYTGLTIEIIRWIGTEMGFTPEFQPMTFKEAQQAILDGNADVLSSFFYSVERDKLYDFTEIIFEIPGTIFVKRERPDIKILSDLNGKIISMQRGDYALEYLKKNNIHHTVKFTDTFSEAADLVINGEADALIGDEQIVLYHLYRNNKHELLKTVGEPLFIGQCGMAVKEGNQITLGILQKGIMHAQATSTITKIYKKWLGTEFQTHINLWEMYKFRIIGFGSFVVFLLFLTWFWNVLLKRQVKDRTRELETLNAVLHNDISEREKVEKALYESEEKYRQTVNLLPVGVYEFDLKGNFMFTNLKAQEMFEYDEQDVENGLNVMHVLDASEVDAVNTAMERLIRGEVAIPKSYMVQAKSGRKFPVEIHSSVVYRDSKPVGFRGILIDITEKRRAEEEVLRTNKLESVGLLAGGIAHDFNNILAAILGNITLAKLKIGNNPQIETYLSESAKACERAKELTFQLLTFAKGGEPIRESALLHDIIFDSANFSLHGSKVTGKFSISDDLRPAAIDKGQFSRVIHNIVINAVQSMPSGGQVKITAENIDLEKNNYYELPQGSYVCIRICDNGPGIAQEHIKKIFDPYFTTRENGSGLGLAIVFSIIKKHSGTIALESEIGKGSCFSIVLPSTTLDSVENKHVDSELDFKDKKILFMDDEPMIRAVADGIFSHLGCEVTTVEEGEIAIKEYIKAASIDMPYTVVIMDLTVPGKMGGVEAARNLKALYPDACIVVSSGYADDDVLAKFSDFGFSAVLRKPFTLEDVKKLLFQIQSV